MPVQDARPIFRQGSSKSGAVEDSAARRPVAHETFVALPVRRARSGQSLRLPDEASAACRTMTEIVDDIVGRQGRPIWMKKSSLNFEHVSLQVCQFRGARFAHFIRDGRDAWQSFHGRWPFDRAHTIGRWKYAIRLGASSALPLALRVTCSSATKHHVGPESADAPFLRVSRRPFITPVRRSCMRQLRIAPGAWRARAARCF